MRHSTSSYGCCSSLRARAQSRRASSVCAHADDASCPCLRAARSSRVFHLVRPAPRSRARGRCAGARVPRGRMLVSACAPARERVRNRIANLQPARPCDRICRLNQMLPTACHVLCCRCSPPPTTLTSSTLATSEAGSARSTAADTGIRDCDIVDRTDPEFVAQMLGIDWATPRSFDPSSNSPLGVLYLCGKLNQERHASSRPRSLSRFFFGDGSKHRVREGELARPRGRVEP